MIQIKSDPARRIDIPGVPHPVKRPVDIDESITGFTSLRTLRIYQFDKDATIDGHAEEDEVFIVVLSGAIDLTILVGEVEVTSSPMVVTAPDGSPEETVCAAYLPPHAAYKLTARSDADVAYVRATPTDSRPPKVFFPLREPNSDKPGVLLEETSYAERLRFRLIMLTASETAASFTPIGESEDKYEPLVYVRSEPLSSVSAVSSIDAAPTWLNSWDTLAVAPGEKLTFTIAGESTALILAVMAI